MYKHVGYTATDDSSSLANHGQALAGAMDDAQCRYSPSLSGDGNRLIVGSNGFGIANIMEKTGLCAVYEIQDENWIQIEAWRMKQLDLMFHVQKWQRSQLQQEHLC